MTAEERIEKLLNLYGQTIADLPKSADNDWSTHVYEFRHLISAKKAALVFWMDEWQDTDAVPEIRYEVEECLLDYICHLADIIDRMDAALETATRWYPCDRCEYGFTDEYWAKTCPCYKDGEYEESGFRIADKLLIDEQED